MSCNPPAPRRCRTSGNPPPPPVESASRRNPSELLVPLVCSGSEPHLGRGPLRTPIAMPAPTRTLTLADVRRFVDEEVFTPREGSRHPGGSASSSSGSWSRATAAARAAAGRARPRSSRRAPRREPDHVRAGRPARAERPGRTLVRRSRAKRCAPTPTRGRACALDHHRPRPRRRRDRHPGRPRARARRCPATARWRSTSTRAGPRAAR